MGMCPKEEVSGGGWDGRITRNVNDDAKNKRKWNLVGDSVTLLLDELSCLKLLLNRSLARESNLVLTNGDFSDCSDSEFSCSVLTDLPLLYIPSSKKTWRWYTPQENIMRIFFIILVLPSQKVRVTWRIFFWGREKGRKEKKIHIYDI